VARSRTSPCGERHDGRHEADRFQAGRPVSRKSRPIGIDAVFDIETESWSTYVLGAVLTSDGRYFATRDPEALAARILQIDGDVWAHNGGRYDALWLLSVLDAWGTPWRAHLAGARITLLEAGRARIRDSFALIPMGLAKGAALGGQAKAETGFKCSCGKACGGYCRIRRGMPERDYRRLDGYLRQDCVATLAMLRAVAGWLEGEAIPLRGTIGSTAWAGAQAQLDCPSAKWSASAYQLARGGYYGGRVEVYQPVAPRAYMYDRNSSYPAALVETAVPVGDVRTVSRGAGRAYSGGWPGIYRVEVEVPECEFPPLPVRLESGIAYPWGGFGGAWTALELRAAESRGAKIQRVDYGVIWQDVEKLYAPYCERIWKLRSGSDAPWAAWIKWLANSLTGKLAQKPERRIVVGGRGLKPAPWEPLGPSLRIWTRPAWRIGACAHVQQAAYLTASARVELLCQMESAPSRSVLYCDTDSDPSAEPQTRKIGPELGEWKFEGLLHPWRCWAPKLYAAGDKVVAKGMPGIDAAGLARLCAGEPHVSDRGVSGLATAARGGGSLFRRQRLSRISHADGLHFGSRILASDGRTVARSYRDLTSGRQMVSSGLALEEEGE